MVQPRVKRAVEFAQAASIASAKTIIDAMLNRPRASLSFQWLTNDRFYVHLVFALTRIGPVGCKAGSAHRAFAMLPSTDFLKNIRVNWHQPSDGILMSENRAGNGILHISRHYYFSSPNDKRIFAPYYAHPDFYKTGLYNAAREMRNRERRTRIFFSGNISSSTYSDGFAFQIMTRDKILAHVIARFGNSIRNEISENDRRPILILVSDDTKTYDTERSNFRQPRLSIKEYIATMSHSDFFICPPGWLMPHSHNLIEAMSVGTIPITNYHSFMRPPLTPHKDCLTFSTIEELERIIEYALAMPQNEIQRLRKGVISYYDNYLEPESFGRKLIEMAPNIQELVVNDESGR